MTQLGTKKSRKGCTNCKRRRVKCNEQVPCANCSRRGEQCSLLGSSVAHADLSHDNHCGLPRTAEEWLEDLELMHHYDRDTLVHPLGIRHDVQEIWRQNIPQEATKYPFLMHGILAMSALHIAHERPAEADKYIRACDKHQSKALELFRSVLCAEITPEISTALFALSSTISILSMARSCADALAMPAPRFVSMEQIAELFLLTRGVRDLIYSCTDWVATGPLAPMLDEQQYLAAAMPGGRYGGEGTEGGGGGDVVPLPASVQKQFAALHQMLVEYCTSEFRGECEQALHDLEAIYRSVVLRICSTSSSSPLYGGGSGGGDEQEDVVEPSQIWRWTLFVPAGFVRMISACYPPALVILAHFAAVSLTVRKAWYTKDWGHYALTGISMCLYGTEMHQHLVWPIEHARNNMMILSHIGEIDSVMNENSPPPCLSSLMAFDRSLSLERGDLGAEAPVVATAADFDFMNF